jgi:hypothetical protein
MEEFIQSMYRCKPWAAAGGKSGSSFCKTHGASQRLRCIHLQTGKNACGSLVCVAISKYRNAAAFSKGRALVRWIYTPQKARSQRKLSYTPSPPADNRYILKQLSRVEVTSLVAFAKSYISYMIDAIRENVCPA